MTAGPDQRHDSQQRHQHRGRGVLRLHQPDQHTIPNSVTTIGADAFSPCTGLTNVRSPTASPVSGAAFGYCTSLKGVYFQGNAPSLGGSNVFDGDNNATVYYLPGTTGWGSTFGIVRPRYGSFRTR